MEPALYSSRYECKYLLSEDLAREVRDRLSLWMELDAFCAGLPSNSYPNTSLYFDTPQRLCVHSVLAGEKNRFKVRARWYGDGPGAPAFLEEKRRTTDTISKRRIHLLREGLDVLCSGEFPDQALLDIRDDSDAALAEWFRDRIDQLRLEPSCHVRYQREAWMSAVGEDVRVTFDRALEAHSVDGWRPAAGSPGWIAVGHMPVVLEIKFVAYLPAWLSALIADFELYRQPVPKYVLCHAELDGPGAVDTVLREGRRPGWASSLR
jgi:hypothetical protein